MSWKTFEEECIVYLNEKYGCFFELKGKSNSTISDIFFDNGRIKFYIESKMSTAQCGQFVLLPNFNSRIFEYSSKNKTKENEYTEMIINFMNKKFDDFSNAGTTGVTIEMSQYIFYNWIINYYKEKGVEFFITKDRANKFIIFPISELNHYFNVSAKYREKKSGSSSLNESSKVDFKHAMDKTSIEYSFNGLDIISNANIDGLRVNGNKYDYLLKGNNRTYKVRKLSNTRNANVIFSIELKPYLSKKQALDELKFDIMIKK